MEENQELAAEHQWRHHLNQIGSGYVQANQQPSDVYLHPMVVFLFIFFKKLKYKK